MTECAIKVFAPSFFCNEFSTDDWYNGMSLGKLAGVVFIDLEKLSTLSTMISFAKSWNTMVFKVGV